MRWETGGDTASFNRRQLTDQEYRGPYREGPILSRHLQALDWFARITDSARAATAIVLFEVGVVASPQADYIPNARRCSFGQTSAQHHMLTPGQLPC